MVKSFKKGELRKFKDDTEEEPDNESHFRFINENVYLTGSLRVDSFQLHDLLDNAAATVLRWL